MILSEFGPQATENTGDPGRCAKTQPMNQNQHTYSQGHKGVFELWFDTWKKKKFIIAILSILIDHFFSVHLTVNTGSEIQQG